MNSMKAFDLEVRRKTAYSALNSSLNDKYTKSKMAYDKSSYLEISNHLSKSMENRPKHSHSYSDIP